MMRKTVTVILAAIFVLSAAGSSWAIGMLVPKDKTIPPLAIKSHRVEVVIKEQGAETTVKQVFLNNTNQDLEATYYFPLPPGAAATDFALWINGKKAKGEVLDAAGAKQIYREIVSRMKDPGLLEYMGGNLFKASIYPVPRKGEQKVEIKYAMVVPYDAGVCSYVYPLRTDRGSARTIEDFTVSLDINATSPIKAVYSPTHEISLTRMGDFRVRAGFEKSAALLDRDFQLFYTLSEKDVGISALTNRATNGDGYFLLLVTPSPVPEASSVMAKDVIFVLDTSGSMMGEKMNRAKQALAYCLNNLGPEDRFNIVRFSDGIRPMSKELLYAEKKNIDRGQQFVKGLSAAGATNINEALLTALEDQGDSARPGIIVFLTDGEPTIGVTDTASILTNAKQANKGGWRIFSFGVGTTINTHLLDKLSGENGGTTAYVKPDAQIEKEVSSFFNKIEKPVLSDVELDFGGLEVEEMFPRELPDLFAGMQLTILGRYEQGCHAVIRLSGKRKGATITMTEEIVFPDKENDNGFIKQLWATRKVGYLLDEIRLHGEKTEIVEEVTRLGKKYGIVTPYTSYLVTEPKTTIGMDRRNRDGFLPPPHPDAPMVFGGAGQAEQLMRKADKTRQLDALSNMASMVEETGATAVDAGNQLSEMKDQEKIDNFGPAKVAAGKTFILQGGAYVDTEHKPGDKILKIKFGSNAYFRFLELYPKAKDFLALGERIIVTVKAGRAIVIADDGAESLPDNQIKAFLP